MYRSFFVVQKHHSPWKTKAKNLGVRGRVPLKPLGFRNHLTLVLHGVTYFLEYMNSEKYVKTNIILEKSGTVYETSTTADSAPYAKELIKKYFAQFPVEEKSLAVPIGQF
ncbi:MAG: hypothetical protein RR415_12880 [Ruthenibacterium sp.]